MPTDPLPTASALPRREFLAGVLALGAAPLGGQGQTVDVGPVLGPLLGHADDTSALVWMRVGRPGEFTLEVEPESGGAPRRLTRTATAQDDFCLHWQVGGLEPDTRYRYRVLQGGAPLAADSGQRFRTAPAPGAPAKVRLAVSSCAKEDEGSRAVWRRMAAENVDAVVLIGDTPYIDSTDLDKQTQRHREFAAVAEYQALLRSRPCWWTWDDHDFAGNDASGLAAGKENTRLVFRRYRPQKT